MINLMTAIETITKNIKSRWRLHCRHADIVVLWPIIKSYSDSIEHARVAFLLHAIGDSAWSDLDNAEMHAIIDTLE